MTQLELDFQRHAQFAQISPVFFRKFSNLPREYQKSANIVRIRSISQRVYWTVRTLGGTCVN